MPKIVNPGFLEFLQDSVKGLLGDMPWLKGRTLKLAGSLQEVKEFVDKAVMTPLCAVDLETTSLNSRTRKVVENGEVKRIPIGKIVGISLCYERTTSLYIPMNHIEDANLNIPEQDVLEEIRRLCANCVTVYHNMKFDGNYLAIHGVYIDGYMKFEDTQLLGRLYDAGQKDLKLKNLSARLLNQPMITFEEISKGKSFSMVSPQVGYIYAASDAMCTLDLYHYFMANDIVKEQKAIYNLEKRLVPVVMEMENNFIKVDVEYLKKIRTDLLKAKEGIVKEIYALVGREFNIGSTQQMGKILFDELKYRYPESQKTASGQYMTDNAVLEKIADLYPIVKKIISYRSMEKVLGTYIENLLNNHDEDGCIKLGFHQSGTDTGRFSSPGGSGIDDDGYSGVNVQSIPKQVDESTPDIRRAFVARPGYKLVAADYENEELRVATNISNETAWIDAIRRGVDFHTATGALIAGKRPEDLDPKGPERAQGKMVNFLALYQGGPRSLAAKTKISETEAKRVLTAFFAGVPKLKAWINRSIALARREKKVKTVFGRVRPLDRYYNSGDSALESHADRCACNTHIQGCLQAHERCLTSEGYLKIKDIIEIKKIRPIKVWTGTSWEDFEVISRGEAQLAEIELSNGIVLECDTRHEVLVVGVNGYEFKKFEELNEKTMICTSIPTLKEFGNFPDKYHFIGNVHNSKDILISTEDNWNDLAYIIGCVIGDGHLIDNKAIDQYYIGISYGEAKLKTTYIKINECFKRLNIKVGKLLLNKGSLGVSYSQSINSKGLVKLIKSLGYDFKGALNKRVPDYFFKSPSSMRINFLKGFYDTDGCKTFGNRHGFHTPNKKLLQDVILLGWTLGCASYINDTNQGTYRLQWADQWKIEKILDLKSPLRKRRYNSGKMLLPEFLKGKILKLFENKPYRNNNDRVYLWKIRTNKNVCIPGVLDLITDNDLSPPPMYYHYQLKEKRILNKKEETFTLSVKSSLHRFDSGSIISKNTSADIMKTVMVRMYNWIHSENLTDEIKILITMHDELVFEVKEDKLDVYIPKIAQIMMLKDILQGILKWPVPLTVEVKYGDSWRVKANYFEEHPEAKAMLDEPIKFHQEGQIGGRYAIATQKDLSSPVEKALSSPVEEAVKPAQAEDQIKGETEISNSQGETGIKLSDIAAMEKLELHKEKEDVNSDSDDVFVYTLKELSKSNLRRLNDILTFLLDENSKNEDLYKAPRKIIRIKDSKGNNLSVTEYKFPVATFLGLARYIGI